MKLFCLTCDVGFFRQSTSSLPGRKGQKSFPVHGSSFVFVQRFALNTCSRLLLLQHLLLNQQTRKLLRPNLLFMRRLFLLGRLPFYNVDLKFGLSMRRQTQAVDAALVTPVKASSTNEIHTIGLSQRYRCSVQ